MILQSTSCTLQDFELNRKFTMDSKSDSVTPVRPPPARRRISGGTSASEVFGFTVDENQFAVLQSEQTAAPQREMGLVDPRTTKHLRWST